MPIVRARVMFWFWGRCLGLIGFWLDLGSGCDVRVGGRLCLRFMIWYG